MSLPLRPDAYLSMLLLAEFIVWIVGVAVLVFYFLPWGVSTHVRRRAPRMRARNSHRLAAPAPSPGKARRTAFKACRLTASTFLIVEIDDIYSEHPYIYVKVVPWANTVVVLDTGCGGATNDPDVDVTSLRDFIETVGVEDNNGRPLNEEGRMQYIIVLSHCHYDHILGVEDFAKDSTIFESGHDPSFVSPTVLPAHSLCESLGVRTPSFTPTLIPHKHHLRSVTGLPLDIVSLHTPGHTPDELALWDASQLMLYVGDTLYEFEPIIFPHDGNIRTWLLSVDELIATVMASRSPEEVFINCGHRTTMRPALDVLRSAKQFMLDVLLGKEKVRGRTRRRGVDYVEYMQDGGRYSMRCPERLVEEARDVVRWI